MGWIEGPAKTIDAVVNEMAHSSDEQILAALAKMEPLPDESDSRWNDDTFWFRTAVEDDEHLKDFEEHMP